MRKGAILKKKTAIRFVFLFLLFITVSCGGGSGNGVDDTYRLSEYYPLETGNYWVYKEYEDGLPLGDNMVSVSGSEILNGETAYKVYDKLDAETTWYSINDNGLYEHHVEYDDGDFIHMTVPLRLYPGRFSSNEIIFTNDLQFLYSILGIEGDGFISVTSSFEGVEDISVPAGSFQNCLRFTRKIIFSFGGIGTITGTANLWFAKGIGPVKTTNFVVGYDGTPFTYDTELNYFSIQQTSNASIEKGLGLDTEKTVDAYRSRTEKRFPLFLK